MIPQMSPMNWAALFTFFNLVFFMSTVKIFYVSSTVVNSQSSDPLNTSTFSYKI